MSLKVARKPRNKLATKVASGKSPATHSSRAVALTAAKCIRGFGGVEQ